MKILNALTLNHQNLLSEGLCNYFNRDILYQHTPFGEVGAFQVALV